MSLIRADARAIPLVDGCVQTVVTSPPYWGLRDYGTSRWVGGSIECSHAPRAQVAGSKTSTSAGQLRDKPSMLCKCGAQRIDSQLGMEPTPDAFVASLVAVFAEVWRVLKDDGTVWLNLGDSYIGSGMTGGTDSKEGSAKRSERMFHGNRRDTVVGFKQKDLAGVPWRVAFALQAAGWYLRSDIIWSKPNPMPESVTDRPTKAHEYIFLLTKQERYYYDADAIREEATNQGGGANFYASRGMTWTRSKLDEDLRNGGTGRGLDSALTNSLGRNKRSVWHVATQPYAGSHFATFPEALIEPCILAGSRPGDLVFDPFIGSGTVGAVSERLMRRWVGTDLSYQHLAKKRTRQRGLKLEATA